ncbi:hypothetical protein MEBOL_003269 [Melittangium boletus DSM 14713]|uniref:Uncharacterized protein n=2 Tax=Melittangium boletus TaxID=83453 RepID=A0A250ID80_9BACT|nr:hypothetical protein MEBOL_003269 [Melittangium boletus DSM 14713]
MRSAEPFEPRLESTAEPGIFRVESRPLGQVLPANLLSGGPPFDVAPDQTAMELLETGLAEALSGATNSTAFDAGLLETFSAFARLFEQGVELIEFVQERVLRMDRDAVERMAHLRRQMPASRAVWIAGTLDLPRPGDRVFTLVPRSGAVLKGLAEQMEPARLLALRGRSVVVSGMVAFRPSGAIARIHAEQMHEASARDLELWSDVPGPLWSLPGEGWSRADPETRLSFEALLGSRPEEDEESEEDFLAALEEMS